MMRFEEFAVVGDEVDGCCSCCCDCGCGCGWESEEEKHEYMIRFDMK